MRATRWLTILTFVAAAATAAILGGAWAAAESDRVRTLVAIAFGGVLVFVAAGGAWTIASRRAPLLERAETASTLAHELKNPLMAIKGLASTGARLYDEMGDEEKLEFFRLIDEEAARLKRVVEQSATSLRVDAGQVLYERNALDLGALVEEVARGADPTEHAVTVEAQEGITVLADRRRLAETIESLIDNAAKFSPPGAPIEISVRADGGERAAVEVADRGPGIPADRVRSVFERFSRWRPAGYEETPGAGLGLFLARAHVTAHDGRIDVDERAEGGTVVRVTLPREG